MKARTLITSLLVIVICSFGFRSEPIFVAPKHWPNPVYDFNKNPLSKERVLLGRVLFYDPILSKNNLVSCANCHSPYNAFTHVDHALSHGIFDSIGTRNSPALMNLAWHQNFMWDGAINHLDMQALAPISNPSEMGENMGSLVGKLQALPRYQSLFYAAYQDSLVTGERVLKSISQFMLTLVSAESKYDSVMRGDSKFTEQEQKGYALFKKHCNSCHTEPLFTNLQFENNGLSVDPSLNDYGRYRISQNPNDSFKFKVPTLRNISYSYPYMHDGRFTTLTQVLAHYTAVKSSSGNLAKQLRVPIGLSSNDKVDLTAFLISLNDRHFLFNANFAYPKEVFFAEPKGR
jgi:cytochrome c peroxidase